tara:strand:+ start:998 stop:1384 length:387 start_codon:yes stop_codon:yes gene_type:complete
MDRDTGRPNHIEDVLIELHGGQWFTWLDPFQKVYENLILTEKVSADGGEIIDNPVKSLPTEKELTDALIKKQADFDAEAYARTRVENYPRIEEQLDLLYHDMASGKGDKTGEWFIAIKKVKDDNPKPE